jgi:hypothetical protein
MIRMSGNDGTEVGVASHLKVVEMMWLEDSLQMCLHYLQTGE